MCNLLKIAKVNETAWFGSKKFKNIIFENTKTFPVQKVRIYFAPINDSWGEERILIKVALNIKKRNIFSIQCIM